MLGRRISKFGGGLIGAWFLIFVPRFFGAPFLEARVPRWAIPTIAAVAIACGVYAMFVRRRNPPLAAGIFTGIAIGLLHASWCFSVG